MLEIITLFGLIGLVPTFIFLIAKTIGLDLMIISLIYASMYRIFISVMKKEKLVTLVNLDTLVILILVTAVIGAILYTYNPFIVLVGFISVILLMSHNQSSKQ